MSTKDSSLYGVPRPKKSTGKEISSSTSLAFSSHLSSLIASNTPKASSTTTASSGRTRLKKDSIFNTHNKGALKRAHADISTSSPAFEQRHSTSGEALDTTEWRRAQRRMEDKARLYAAMKRGDVEDSEERHLIDFDRKWAERKEKGLGSESEVSSDDNNNASDGDDEIVEYVDEFGRTRQGTKADVARQERNRKRKLAAQADDPDRFTARPAAPTNIIYGDAIQSAAFDPDAPVAEQMAELAAKRDKEATPPPDEHFDARKEVRMKGTGFFQFSQDEEERKAQMEGLEEERRETERRRREREERKEERKREIEERRKNIGQKRVRKQADAFLEGLGEEMFGNKEAGDEGKDGSDKVTQDAAG
ncbi:MAG: hypothetical protein Q9165_001251 [Trypethelium subeluteriae]